MTGFLRRLRFLPLLLVLAGAVPAAGRELHWSSLDVKARLDAQGALHVVERHAMVFTGDWNGGERVFRVFPGQTLGFESIRRIEPDGTARELSAGDLSAVDQFAWHADKTLRWRSRLPSDPSFDNTELVYEIAYTLHGILVKQGDRYLLDHDFAFPDRAGSIGKFTLALELDPVWKPERTFSGLSLSGLRPGESAVVKLALEHTGAGPPVAGRTVASPTVRWALLGVLAAAIVLLYFRFRSRESALGRFAPLTKPEAIDEAWLDANLFPLSPEEAGALWDEKIGPPEVAAVLARLQAEKKISTKVEGKKLSMSLLVPLEKLQGYDEDLLEAFFFGGRTETDTDAVKKHYKSTGFDPVSKIKPGLEGELKKQPDFQGKSKSPSPWPTLALFLAGAAAFALSVLGGGEDGKTVIGIGIVHGILFLIGAICAVSFQKRIDRVDAFSPVFLWVPAFLLYFAWTAARDGVRSGLFLIAGVLLVRLGIVNSVFNIAKIRSGAKRIARRKSLASARAFFAQELSRSAPRLKDEWFPYVVAFGLTGDADRWFRAYGAAAAAAGSRPWSGSTSGSSSSSSSSSSGSGSWSGGGGAFGGAGASGTWAVAAGALAAGVSSPSSSSGGGGGGGGGGGSSGGGGGGGW